MARKYPGLWTVSSIRGDSAAIAAALLLAGVSTSACAQIEPRTVEDADAILYIPVRSKSAAQSPLVVAFSPGADAAGMMGAWKPIADEFGWMILASKRFHNGPDTGNVLASVATTVRSALSRYPVDPNKIILTGISGGAMAAYHFAFEYPKLAFAVVANTGMMRDDEIQARAVHPRNKNVVFLSSPTDFRYQEMQRDRRFLAGLGWKTKWIEFAGGHTMAPESAYREAAVWIQQRMQAGQSSGPSER